MKAIRSSKFQTKKHIITKQCTTYSNTKIMFYGLRTYINATFANKLFEKPGAQSIEVNLNKTEKTNIQQAEQKHYARTDRKYI